MTTFSCGDDIVDFMAICTVKHRGNCSWQPRIAMSEWSAQTREMHLQTTAVARLFPHGRSYRAAYPVSSSDAEDIAPQLVYGT
jgi:hypothetical protein